MHDFINIVEATTLSNLTYIFSTKENLTFPVKDSRFTNIQIKVSLIGHEMEGRLTLSGLTL